MCRRAANGQYTLNRRPSIYGMVDGHAHHNSGATCPLPLLYAQIGNALPTNALPIDIGPYRMSRTVTESIVAIASSEGVNIQRLSTAEMGTFLAELNTAAFRNRESAQIYEEYKELFAIKNDRKKLLRGRIPYRDSLSPQEWRELNELDSRESTFMRSRTVCAERAIPSLVIVPTMDMEFAHLAGYEGKTIYRREGNAFFWEKITSVSRTTASPILRQRRFDVSHEAAMEPIPLSDDCQMRFHGWVRQVNDTENAVAANPLRLFPLFFYEPRRYRYDRVRDRNRPKLVGCGFWNEPFARIVGHTHREPGVSEESRVWIGFKMYPPLGHKPYDEFCEYLPKFYSECQAKNIPILTHCSPGGMTTHDARHYVDYDNNDHIIRLRWGSRRAAASIGVDRTDSNPALDYFFKNYGHPENWRPVLERHRQLRLCLAHFGGSEWENNAVRNWLEKPTRPMTLPPREWIRSIIDLTKRYDNVYTDLSCHTINDVRVRSGLSRLLHLIHENHPEFAHLKDKLIFGTDWYLTHLTMNRRDARYGKYCNDFKALFDNVDRSGEFWERVSLINPWNCYALSEEKFNDIYNATRNAVPKCDASCDGNTGSVTLAKLSDLNHYISQKRRS